MGQRSKCFTELQSLNYISWHIPFIYFIERLKKDAGPENEIQILVEKLLCGQSTL